MPIERHPNDPTQTTPRDENDRAGLRQEDIEVAAASEPAVTGGRVAMFAGAVIIALGLVFYGMNTTSVGPNDAVTAAPVTAPVNQSAQQTPAVRDVAPNSQPGVTTGAAPNRPAAPSMAPTDSGNAAPTTR